MKNGKQSTHPRLLFALRQSKSVFAPQNNQAPKFSELALLSKTDQIYKYTTHTLFCTFGVREAYKDRLTPKPPIQCTKIKPMWKVWEYQP